LSRYQNAGQNNDVLIANESFENVTTVKRLRTSVTDNNFIHYENRAY